MFMHLADGPGDDNSARSFHAEGEKIARRWGRTSFQRYRMREISLTELGLEAAR
jgi:hypothetical protein